MAVLAGIAGDIHVGRFGTSCNTPLLIQHSILTAQTINTRTTQQTRKQTFHTSTPIRIVPSQTRPQTPILLNRHNIQIRASPTDIAESRAITVEAVRGAGLAVVEGLVEEGAD